MGVVTQPDAARLDIPEELKRSHAKFFGPAGHAWITALPRLVAHFLARWQLRRQGAVMCGAVALVLPVIRADGAPAVLKVQPIDDETAGEPIALGAWDGRGAVRLLRHDPVHGVMLLEQLDAGLTLGAVRDDLASLQILSELLVSLNAVAAPNGMRRLADIAGAMLDRAPHAMAGAPDAADRRLIDRCAQAVTDLLPEAGDRILHGDLHYDNVLGVPPASGVRAERWLAIDPKPLAGDPGFELLPALHNRWSDVLAIGDVPRAIRRRFDLMTDVTGIDRQRAVGWTLGRVLQNLLWEVDNGDTMWNSGPDRAVAHALIGDY